ncbi:MAG TPA: hypothetical protein PKD86_09250 [Gemmatales bacterium]|nr:hypothetical protein [Gemmatales bacterium]HMP59525.1 hypothetical protein [Gemmatales bacterium]
MAMWWIVLLAFADGPGAPLTAENLEARLRARDSKLANYSLEYRHRKKSWTRAMATANFSIVREGTATRLGTYSPSSTPQPPFRWNEYRKELTCRGEEVTVRSSPVDRSNGIDFQKWSNVGGVFRDYTWRMGSGDPMDASWIMEKPAADFEWILKDERLVIEVAHGFGATRLLSSVTSVNPETDGWLLVGTLQRGPAVFSDFRIWIDQDLVVRQLVLEGKSEGVSTGLMVVRNLGSRRAGEFVFPEKGTHQSGPASCFDGLELKRANRLTPEEEYTFVDIRVPLSDEAYADLTAMKRPNNAYVWNRIENTYEYVDDKGTVKERRPLKVPRPMAMVPTWPTYVILSHFLAFVLGVAVVWLLQRRRRKSSPAPSS